MIYNVIFLFQAEIQGEPTISLFDVIWNGGGRGTVIGVAVIIVLLIVGIIFLKRKSRLNSKK